jgi:hypothetical protein
MPTFKPPTGLQYADMVLAIEEFASNCPDIYGDVVVTEMHQLASNGAWLFYDNGTLMVHDKYAKDGTIRWDECTKRPQKLDPDNPQGTIFDFRPHWFLQPAETDVLVAAFVKRSPDARGKMVVKYGADKADAYARKCGLKSLHDYKSVGKIPEGSIADAPWFTRAIPVSSVDLTSSRYWDSKTTTCGIRRGGSCL